MKMVWPMSGRIVVASLWLLLSLLAPLGLRAEVSVSATLDRATISLDEEAELTIRVNGARSADIELPEVEGLAISRRGQSNQLSMINGSISSSVSVSYVLSAEKTGQFTIPPITVKAGDAKLTTEALPLVVTSGRQEAGQDRDGNGQGGEPLERAFIEITGLKEKLYIGEMIPVRINAYFRQGLRANLTSFPSLAGDGCVIPQLNKDPVQSRTTVNGESYTLLTWDTHLTTIKEGKHLLRLGLDATLLIPQRKLSTSMFGQQNPFDDDFFDGVFGGYQQKNLHLTTKEWSVTVEALPSAGRPTDFTGAVGDFSLQAMAKPLAVGPGEPINLTMTISGKGNFDRVEPPVFPDGDNWKTYAPSSKFTTDSDALSGTKTFEQALIVKNTHIKEIPSLRFSYFDPDKNQYITKVSTPIAITLTGNAPPALPPSPPAPLKGAPPTEEAGPAAPPHDSLTDLAPLQLELGRTVAKIKPPFAQAWLVILVIACLLWLAVLVVVALRRHGSLRYGSDEHKKRLQSALADGLKAMGRARSANAGEAFLVEARKLLQQQLGAHWQMEPGAITQADIRQRLPEAPRLLEIMVVAEQAAYGGATLSQEQMESYARALQEELEKLS